MAAARLGYALRGGPGREEISSNFAPLPYALGLEPGDRWQLRAGGRAAAHAVVACVRLHPVLHRRRIRGYARNRMGIRATTCWTASE